jgi:hypothetical protein
MSKEGKGNEGRWRAVKESVLLINQPKPYIKSRDLVFEVFIL